MQIKALIIFKDVKKLLKPKGWRTEILVILENKQISELTQSDHDKGHEKKMQQRMEINQLGDQ